MAVTVTSAPVETSPMKEENYKFAGGNLQAQKLGLNLSYFRVSEHVSIQL